MSTLPPAGWFDDPGRPGGLRYWDGEQWADARHDAPPARPAPTPPADAPPGDPSEPPAAGWWQRAGALALDAAVVVALYIVFVTIAYAVSSNHADWTSDSDRLPPTAWVALGAGTLVGLLYPWLWSCADRGHTIGKRATGIRVVDQAGRPVSPGRSAIRELACKVVLALLVWALLLSYLWPLWEKRGRALHDLMAGTRVVRGKGVASAAVSQADADATADRDAFGNPV